MGHGIIFYTDVNLFNEFWCRTKDDHLAQYEKDRYKHECEYEVKTGKFG